MRAYERLLKYVKIHTASDEFSGAHPSSARQFDLAKLLCEELKALGAQDVVLSDTCYVYAKLPASKGCESAPKIGFIAHMDTSPDFCGDGVNPIIHENYNGEDLPLGSSGRILDCKTFAHLKSLRGKTLITTDGTTLLGADDKAGIAEIMTLLEAIGTKKLAHGELRFAFTPDEEIGEGADNFSLAQFDADFAYTVDGGSAESIEYENFNAHEAIFEINGFNVHPGDAKGKMVNASLVAMEINAMLPACDTPSRTEAYEGFYHLHRMVGNVESAKLEYIIRDHDEHMLKSRLYLLSHIEKTINERYGNATVKLTLKEQYRNMKERIIPAMHLIDTASRAIESLGLTPEDVPIRGGTDGARLSFMGLPCPNLGTGGYAFHGPYEHITAEGMDTCVNMLLEVVKNYSTQNHL